LGPLLFSIYTNDLELCASQDDSSELYLYADDAKIFKVVSQITEQLDLQAIMNTVKTWSDECLLRLNIDKCKTVSYYSKYPPLDTQYHIADGNTTYTLEKLNSINDLGVMFDSNLTFKDDMAQKINKAYSVLGIVKRNFIHMDESSFILLYKSMVRQHLEYANSVCCPYKQDDIKELEKIQKELPNW